jgi:hypothetical protein
LRCPALQDLPGALSEAQVAEGLGLTSIKSRDWSIFKTSGERHLPAATSSAVGAVEAVEPA